MPIRRQWWAKWAFRFKNHGALPFTVFYVSTDLFLTTLCALVAITFYWSVHYTWQGALIVLMNVSTSQTTVFIWFKTSKLITCAHLLSLTTFEWSLRTWRSRWTLIRWVSENKSRYELDFYAGAAWKHGKKQIPESRLHKSSFFSVLVEMNSIL